VSRISRNNCQASAETLSPINRRRNVSHHPTQYIKPVPPARFEHATPAFASVGFRRDSLVSENRLLAAKIGAVGAQRFSLAIAESGSLTMNKRWIEPPLLNLLMP
jgi:hypothetical protein